MYLALTDSRSSIINGLAAELFLVNHATRMAYRDRGVSLCDAADLRRVAAVTPGSIRSSLANAAPGIGETIKMLELKSVSPGLIRNLFAVTGGTGRSVKIAPDCSRLSPLSDWLS